MKYSYSDIHENCTWKEYIDQFNPIKLELGKTYVQNKGKWDEHHFQIVFVDEKIAVGIEVYSAIGEFAIGGYTMFYVDNGFKYNDAQRPSYRLTEEVTKLNKALA